MVWLNFVDYSVPALALFCLTGASWLVAYVLILRTIFKKGFVALSIFSMPSYLAWDVIRFYFYEINIGLAVKIGMALFGPVSGYLWYRLLLSGNTQLNMKRGASYYAIFFSLTAFWFLFLRGVIPVIDDSSGIVSNMLIVMANGIASVALLESEYRARGVDGVAQFPRQYGVVKLVANVFGGAMCVVHFGLIHVSVLFSVVAVAADSIFVVRERRYLHSAVQPSVAAK